MTWTARRSCSTSPGRASSPDPASSSRAISSPPLLLGQLLIVKASVTYPDSKNSKENLDFYCFVTFLDLLSLKNDVNVPSKSYKQKNLFIFIFFVGVLKVNDENSRIRIRIPDPDPDPHQSVMDPEHWLRHSHLDSLFLARGVADPHHLNADPEPAFHLNHGSESCFSSKRSATIGLETPRAPF
jgi:hypothetical protein